MKTPEVVKDGAEEYNPNPDSHRTDLVILQKKKTCVVCTKVEPLDFKIPSSRKPICSPFKFWSKLHARAVFSFARTTMGLSPHRMDQQRLPRSMLSYQSNHVGQCGNPLVGFLQGKRNHTLSGYASSHFPHLLAPPPPCDCDSRPRPSYLLQLCIILSRAEK